MTLQFHIYSRDLLLDNAKQQIKSLEVKLVSANASHQSDKEAWEMNLQNLEETWRRKTSMLSQIMMILTFFSFIFVQSIDAYQLSILIRFTLIILQSDVRHYRLKMKHPLARISKKN